MNTKLIILGLISAVMFIVCMVKGRARKHEARMVTYGKLMSISDTMDRKSVAKGLLTKIAKEGGVPTPENLGITEACEDILK